MGSEEESCKALLRCLLSMLTLLDFAVRLGINENEKLACFR
jgi:hypothetical protein